MFLQGMCGALLNVQSTCKVVTENKVPWNRLTAVTADLAISVCRNCDADNTDNFPSEY